MDRVKRITSFIIVFGFLCCFVTATAVSEQKAAETEKIEKLREEANRTKREAAQQAKRKALEKAVAKLEEKIAEINLLEDTTPTFAVRQLRISGNTLISADELLKDMPLIYNASDKPLHEAENTYLYDFRVLHEILLEPAETRQVSARTIQGLTQYLLSVYQDRNYAGVYVYVPAGIIERGAELKDQVLPIEVLEAKVTAVTIKTYDPDQTETEKGYLRRSAVEKWSPVKAGQAVNKKELDDFVNLLNLNPDRYVSAVISKGVEPGSIAVGYNIYEANPWHWFIQIDNSGTRERQWNPRIGVINTNLLGIDDTFTAMYQAPWDSTISENWALYGSYDFPVSGPRLRLNVYGGHSEFDITPEAGPFSFLGRGTFYGGILRYNAFQQDGWFFDVTGSLSRERSKVTPSLFPEFLESDVKTNLWGIGVDIHRSNDMSDTSLTFNRHESFGGSSSDEFAIARTNAERKYSIYTTAANHSQYLDPDKIQRISGSFRWITSDERLIPAKMTAFGGMYSVRGYDEYEIIADGGILASAQYEFDLVKYEQSREIDTTEAEQQRQHKPLLRKLALLTFIDYGRAKIEDPIMTEQGHQTLLSIGLGLLTDLGDNFTGGVYYGFPLEATDSTRKGRGRLNVGLMTKW